AMPATTWLRLDAIRVDDARALLARRLGATEVPDALVTRVHEKASGNPFFIEQLAGALAEGGAFTVADGRVVLAGGDAALDRIALPETLQGVVTTRLDRLSPAEQLTLKVASVIGRVFPVSTLHDVHPIREAEVDLASHLANLERLDVTTRAPAEEALAYFFRHVVIHEVAYGLLLEAQRRDLHASVAAWYEARFADDLAPHHGLLAFHFEKADAPERAVQYLELAGRDARAISANREAVGFLRRALDLAERTPALATRARRGRWELWMGDAFHGLGELREAMAHLRAAARAFGRRVPGSTLTIALFAVGQLVVHLAWTVAHAAGLGRAAPAAPDDERLDLSRAYQRISEIAYFENRTALLVYATLVALNVAEAAGASPELARAYANLAITASVIPLGGPADRYGEHAVAMAKELGDGSALSYVLMARGIVLYGRGEVAAAKRAIGEACAIAVRLGDVRRREETVGLTAHLHQLEGSFSDARRVFAEVLDLASSRDDVQAGVWARLGVFDSALYLGDVGDTVTWPEDAARLVEKHPVRGDAIYAHGLSAVARRLRGDAAGARAAATRAIELMEATLPTSVYALEGYSGAVETAVALYLASGAEAPTRDAELLRLARRGVAELFRFARPFAIARPRALLFRAALLAGTGHAARARRAAERAVREA
ncbi:MAG TPA: hypothetical protein VHB21_24870, partial [Minicystis sp.]|nr:hypothetical protein [Minicystis sp.]